MDDSSGHAEEATTLGDEVISVGSSDETVDECIEFNSDEEQNPEDEEIISALRSFSEDTVSIIEEDRVLETLQAIDHTYLKFQYVDFLKDFGRSEPFLLDGDALITYALTNNFLDWRNGGQFLHIIFVIEQFLESLCIRGAQYQIFFFLGNDRLFGARGQSYLLCRKVLIEHLKQSELSGRCRLKIHLVEGSWFSVKTEGWERLLEDVRPVFVMSNNVCNIHCQFSLMQRWFVLSMLLSGNYVVVFDGLKLVGSRVKAFLFQPPFPNQASKIKECMSVFEPSVAALAEQRVDLLPEITWVNSTEIPSFQDTRSCIYVQSLRLLLRAGKQKTKGFAAICFACIEVVRQLPLTARTFVLPGDDAYDTDGLKLDALSACAVTAGFRTAVAEFLELFQAALVKSIEPEHALQQDMNLDGILADIFDGRLFHMLLLQSITGYVPSEPLLTPAMQTFAFACSDANLDYQSAIALLGATETDVQAARLALDRARRVRAEIPSSATAAKLRRIGKHESLLTAVLGDVRDEMTQFEATDDKQVLNLGPFFPHHYHNLKPLDGEPDCFSYDIELRKFKNSTGQNMRQRDRAKHKKSVADFRFQESLLVGTPIKQQNIAEKLKAKDLADLKRGAEKALAQETDSGSAAAEVVTNSSSATGKRNEVKHGIEKTAAKGRQGMVGKKSLCDAVDKFKKAHSTDQPHDYLEKAESVAQNSTEEEAFQLRIHCLRYAATKYASDAPPPAAAAAPATSTVAAAAAWRALPSVATWFAACGPTALPPRRATYHPKQRAIFLIAQRILRLNKSQLDMEGQQHLKVEMAKVLAEQGFDDLSRLLCWESLCSGGQGKPSQPSIRFQLEIVPEHLERPAGIGSDPRVRFSPDKWQKTLLDVVDSGNSALVVAPTSSGKTFICYYVMEQCLRVDDDSVVVYVAPTKPLVNQVLAEISARFSKSYKGSRKLVSAFTRDFRDSDMLNAQILVTVPACLGILLLTGSNCKWTSRIRHIIFDEVHYIGDEGGEEWEQLILLCECPFLALSATLGNAGHFYSWLSKVEAAKGRKIYLVQHNERYNDLCPWLWCKNLGKGGDILQLNPCWVLQKLRRAGRLTMESLPKDLRFLPEQCVALYDAIAPYMKEAAEVSPECFLGRLRPDALWNVSMRDAAAWEVRLKEELCKLGDEAQSRVLQALAAETEKGFADVDHRLGESSQHWIIKEDIPALVSALKRRGMLPAICFRLNRHGCERLAETLIKHYLDSERTWKALNGWDAKQEDLEKQLAQAMESLERYKEKADSRKATRRNLDVDSNSEMSCRQALVDSLKHKLHMHSLPRPDFTVKNVSEETIKEAFGSLQYKKTWTDYVRGPLRDALCRGIGVHHASLPLKYRQAVERLYRNKQLGVVFATGTLAVGINMPTKTCVFVGDAIYLNAMTFRQMAGRAGRRGFDLRGHTVFMAIQGERCARLLRSDLPSLQGNLILSNSLALRLIIRMSSMRKALLADTAQYAAAERACALLVNCPMFNPFDSYGGGSCRSTGEGGRLMSVQMAHCFRFSVEYLLRSHLLRVSGSRGAADKFEGLAEGTLEVGPMGEEAEDETPTSWETLDETGPKTPVAESKRMESGWVEDSEPELMSRQANLMDSSGNAGGDGQLEPNDLAAFVAHIFFMEPSNFAFLSLLTADGGLPMRRLCRPGPGREERVLAVLCNIFCRTRLPRTVADHALAFPAATGPSKVLLPGLDIIGDLVPGPDGQMIREGALLKEILRRHNSDAVGALIGYWTCFVKAYAEQLGNDDTLPVSGVRFPAEASWAATPSSAAVARGADVPMAATSAEVSVPLLGQAFQGLMVEPVVRSVFVGLSGLGDAFGSIGELCSTARRGVYLDPKMVPVFDLPANDADEPLNAYVLDFFKHGQLAALERYNCMQRDTLFDELRSFALLLLALWAAMARRAGRGPDGNGPSLFDDPDVLETFRCLSERFTAVLREAGTSGLLKEAGIRRRD